MKNVETGEIEEMVLTLSEREDLLNTGRYVQQLSTPNFVSMTGGTLSKTSSDWKDLLKTIKKGSGRNNTINI
jgi:hypothetical protein